MYKLSWEKKKQVISALVEGNSIRATCRMVGVAKGTVTRLLLRVGKACYEYQDKTVTNLTSKRIQCDEIWSYCHTKGRNLPKGIKKKHKKFGVGDVWTWVAIDADTRIVPCWHLGTRDTTEAHAFFMNLKSRLTTRPQITTDGYLAYKWAVPHVFKDEVDYGIISKEFWSVSDDGEKRYSNDKYVSCERLIVQGNPDPTQVSTSYIERQNLTMRMNMRRFSRLTNAFSKKIYNMELAVALHFMHYNFCRGHISLSPRGLKPKTPAMASGITDHVWSISEVLQLSESN
jgi:IS1 family transposase